MNRVRLFISVLVACAALMCLAGACGGKDEKAGTAAEGPPAPESPAGDEYVVIAEKLNLRAEPGTASKVVATLERGATVTDRGKDKENVEAEPGITWFNVAYGGVDGWVANSYIVRADLFEAFRKADELGRAGDGPGMVAEVKRINAARGGDENDYLVSPDGRKVLVEVAGMGHVWTGKYLYGPVLFFTAGAGIEYNFGPRDWVYGEWSPDSRFVAEGGGPSYSGPLWILDTKNGETTPVGGVLNGGYKFRGDYLVWFRVNLNHEPRPAELEGFLIPSLEARHNQTGDRIPLLEPDFAKLRPVKDRQYYEVKLVPAAACPEGLKTSPLYREYENEFVAVVEPDW